MPRMYETAWLELKKSVETPKRIVIAAHGKLHPRIYKAIIKEKDMDLVYKMELSEQELKARLKRKSEGGKLTVFLYVSNDMSISMDDF